MTAASRPEGAKDVEKRVRKAIFFTDQHFWDRYHDLLKMVTDVVAALCVEYAREQVEARDQIISECRAVIDEHIPILRAQLQTLRGENLKLISDEFERGKLVGIAEEREHWTQEKAALEVDLAAGQERERVLRELFPNIGATGAAWSIRCDLPDGGRGVIVLSPEQVAALAPRRG